MRKSIWVVAAAAATLFCGCAKETNAPEEEGDAWEVPAADVETAETVDKSTPAEKSAPAEPTPAPDPSLLVALKGSDFKMENTTSPVTGDILRVGHYFKAEAPFELKTSATLVETHLEGKTAEGASPLIGLLIVTTAGKYQSFDLGTRPIDGDQQLKDQVEIGPGKYKAVLSYFKDTGDGKRPHIIVKKMELRKPE